MDRKWNEIWLNTIIYAAYIPNFLYEFAQNMMSELRILFSHNSDKNTNKGND